MQERLLASRDEEIIALRSDVEALRARLADAREQVLQHAGTASELD